jgi:hypothetical protein
MELDMADTKASILSWVVVGVMAITFIIAAKWAANVVAKRWPVFQGLAVLTNAV